MSRAKLRKQLTPTQPPPTPLRPLTQDGLVRPPEPPHSPLLLGDSLGGHSLVQGPQGSSLEVKDPSLPVPEHQGSILELPLSLVGSRPAQGYRHSTQLDLEHQDSTQLGLELRVSAQLGLEHRDSTQLGLEHRDSTQLGLEHRDSTQLGLEPRGNTQLGLEPRGSTQLDLEHQDSTQLVEPPASSLEPPCSTRLDPSKLAPEHPKDPTLTCLTQEPSLVVGCMGLEVQELPSLLQEAPSLVEASLLSPLDHGVLEVVEASLPSRATQGPWDHTGGKRLQEACCPDIIYHIHHIFESTELFRFSVR
ncbi:uncharacterized protein [Salmo salar]|uniref:Uncharacterized protein n=1 Tax=Salmo salar TaxID=8030 RepID=A0A1S3RGV1_SALSA|nr:uncharacterized protein LOC106602745 [Salmo salar]